ncbi:MAG: type II secretion system F family protein [Gammaproteobacteria bacterium]|nr:type II secretion system F family protein [Gammaproteobacteria bacterium]
MDAILSFFRSLSVGTDTQYALFLLATGATVFLFVLGVSFLVLAAIDPVRRRLNEVAPMPKERGKLTARVLKATEPFHKFLLPAKGSERGKIEQRLMFAGFRSSNALPLFYAIKTGLALTLLLGIVTWSAWLPQWSVTKLLFVAMLAAFIGLMMPNYVLDHMVERRQKRLRDAFPDALDMLVVCVEAGLGLTAAIQRVAEELRFSHPELGTEFAQVTAEMRAGVERETALKGLASRTGLEDIRGLVSLLIQTLKFGTSIGETLRVYAEEFRDKRMQRAEELAAKIGTKLIFPLVFCLFPSFFIVAVGPAVVRIMDVFRFLGDKMAH